MKKVITRTYIFNWKSILLLIALVILVILLIFAQTTPEQNDSFGTVIVLSFIIICLASIFYGNFYTKEKEFSKN